MPGEDPGSLTAVVPAREDTALSAVLAVWATLCHIAGASLLIATVVTSAADGSSADPRRLAALYAAASLACLGGAVMSRKLGAVYLIATFYFAIFTALPALVQIQSRQFPFGSTYSGSELNRGFLVLALGQLCLTVGVGIIALRRRRSGARGTVTLPLNRARIAIRLAVLFAFVGVFLAVLAGPSVLFTARFDESTTVSETESMAAQAAFVARSFTLVALLLTVIATKFVAGRSRPRGVTAALVFTASVALVVNFPLALPRFQLLGVGLALLVLLFDFRRPLVKGLFTAGATFFVLYVFASVKDLRSGLSLEKSLNSDKTSYLLTADFDSYKQIVDTVIYFSSASYRWGENFLGVALFWVPRSWWEDKPIHTGEVVSKGLGYPFTNVSNPLPAEGFASWGIIGTVVVLLIAGVAVGALEYRRTGARSPNQDVARLLCYALAAAYTTILLRGALNAVAPMILTAFVLAAVVAVVYYRMRETGGHDNTRRAGVATGERRGSSG